jgi:hypothetical protein
MPDGVPLGLIPNKPWLPVCETPPNKRSALIIGPVAVLAAYGTWIGIAPGAPASAVCICRHEPDLCRSVAVVAFSSTENEERRSLRARQVAQKSHLEDV